MQFKYPCRINFNIIMHMIHFSEISPNNDTSTSLHLQKSNIFNLSTGTFGFVCNFQRLTVFAVAQSKHVGLVNG